MSTALRFALEQIILNSFGALLGIAVAALLLGKLLHNRQVGPLGRSLVYSVGGVIGGLWSYLTFDKEPSTQYLTVPVLAISFLIACLILVGPVVYYRSRKPSVQRGDGSGA